VALVLTQARNRGRAAGPGAPGRARRDRWPARLLQARQQGDLPAVAQEAQRLQLMARTPEAAQPVPGEGLQALVLIGIGYSRGWTAQLDDTDHLEQGIALARRVGRPYLEFTGLAYQAAIEAFRVLPGAEEHSRQAIELAERHGWTGQTAAGVAYTALGGALAWQGQLHEAEAWLQRAEFIVRPEAEAVAALAVPCATSTPSSASTAAPTPWLALATWACSPPQASSFAPAL
jgi:LuxR family transcriptional regulator, maltose regulon positive regulatory protein